MGISGISGNNAFTVQTLVNMRAQLDDLQRQLGTGKKATTYAGLGPQRGLSVGLRTQLASLGSFDDSIQQIGIRLTTLQTSLTSIDTSIHSVKTAATTSAFQLNSTGQTIEQGIAAGQLDQIFGALNTRLGDRYIFSGASPDGPSVAATNVIMNGQGTRAGFNQVMSERNQADGVTGLGRLVIPAVTSTAASLTGTTSTLLADAPAVVQGNVDLSAFTGTGQTFDLNGSPITIPAGLLSANLAAINAQTTPLGVTVSLDGSNQLVMTSADADTPVNLTNPSPAGLFATLGITGGTHDPTNLLTQVPALNGQTLTIAVGANAPLTVTFGTNGAAVPPEVSTIAELNARLGTLAGGSASVVSSGPGTGNITINATSTGDAITVSGSANPAIFGLAAPSAAPTNAATISEDVAPSVFGFKLVSVASTLTGATATGPAGSPPAISVDLGGTQPQPGETVRFTFSLPDGTTEDLTLTATTSSPPGDNQFTIGANTTATANNLQGALTTAVGKLAATSLAAASSIQAANEFFGSNPPMRVVANPPATPFSAATTLAAGTSTNTVSWYAGEAGATPARSTAVARIDSSISVSYGTRANEQALSRSIANIAVFASMTFTTTDPNAAGRYDALKQRLTPNLDGPPGQQKVTDIEAEIAGAQTSMTSAQDRHTQTKAALDDLLQQVDGVSTEETAAKLLTLQTRLQASLQTTSMLLQTSLVNYIK